MEDLQAGREDIFGGKYALKLLQVIDKVTLGNSGGDALESGLGQNAENSTHSIYRGFAEWPLRFDGRS